MRVKCAEHAARHISRRTPLQKRGDNTSGYPGKLMRDCYFRQLKLGNTFCFRTVMSLAHDYHETDIAHQINKRVCAHACICMHGTDNWAASKPALNLELPHHCIKVFA